MIDTYRNTVNRYNNELSRLIEQKSKEIEKTTNLEKQINNIVRTITKNTSVTSYNSKTRQIDNKKTEIARVLKKIANIEKKITAKKSQINGCLAKIEKEEKKLSEKERKIEIAHLKNVTREKEKQLSIVSEISERKFVIDVENLPESINILFIASDSTNSIKPLSLDEEVRAIEQKVNMSKHRDSINIHSKWAVRPVELIQYINEINPEILHISGHGTEDGYLVFCDNNGGNKFVSPEALVTTLSTVSDCIRGVILNSCFSLFQAEQLVEHVEFAIGMNDSIPDNTAILFASQFYSSIGFGKSIKDSYNQAIAAIMLDGMEGNDIPTLVYKEHIEPENIVLVKP